MVSIGFHIRKSLHLTVIAARIVQALVGPGAPAQYIAHRYLIVVSIRTVSPRCVPLDYGLPSHACSCSLLLFLTPPARLSYYFLLSRHASRCPALNLSFPDQVTCAVLAVAAATGRHFLWLLPACPPYINPSDLLCRWFLYRPRHLLLDRLGELR